MPISVTTKIAVALIIGLIVGAVPAYYYGITSAAPSDVVTTVTQTKTVTGGTTTVTNTVTQTTTQTVTATPEPGKVRVAQVYSASPDVSHWEVACTDGLKEAEELYGIEWTYVEFVTMEERERVLRNLAGQGYDIIIDQDTLSWDAIKKVAPDFPNTWFGNPYGAAPEEILQPNVFCLAPYTEDGAYLTGMIAGGMTNSNKIGFPVAFIFPFMTSTFEAIKAGAKAVNPESQGFIVETFTWTDAPKGKESAEALIDQGIDVLVHLSEAVDAGIVQAAGEHGIITISGAPNGDNSGFYERNVATFSYRIDKAIVHVIGLYISGQLENKLYGGGLSDMGWSDVWLEHPEWIPDDVAGQVFKAREQILYGELVIPFIPEPTPP